MKKALFYFVLSIYFVPGSYAQIPVRASYIPFHQTFIQHPETLQSCRTLAKSRSPLYREIAMRHDVFNSGSSAFQFNDSTLNYYDSQGNIDSSIFSLYNVSNSVWVNNIKTTYTSNASGTFDTIIQQSWDAGTSTWTDSNICTYVWSNTFLLLTRNCVAQTSNFVLTINDTVIPNAAGTLDSIDIIDTSTSVPTSVGYLFRYTYDANGRLLSATESVSQNPAQGNFVNLTSVGIAYNAAGLDSCTTDSVWSTVSTEFLISSKSTYTYNSSGSILTEFDSSWDLSNSVYDPTSQETYAYDGNNNDTQYVAYSWNIGVGRWIPNTQYNYQYDANNHNVYEEQFGFTYDIGNNSIAQLPQDQYFYYYKDLNAGITDVRNSFGVKVFPNPASDHGTTLSFTLEGAAELNIVVYDITGKIVLSTRGNFNGGLNSVNIATSGMASGLYTIKLVNPANGNSSVVKLVKE